MKSAHALVLMCLTLSLIILSIQPINVEAQTAPRIKIEPEQTKKLNVGETFTINVTAEQCEAVFAVQVDFHFNPDILDPISILEGAFLRSAGETVLLLNETEIFEDVVPADARVLFVASLTGGSLGVSGSGVVFNVTFEVLADGSTPFELATYDLGSSSSEGTYFMNRDLVEIPPIFVNGFYGSPIILSATPAKIKPGENTTIVGTVGGINESQSVTIQYRKQGGNWSNLTTLNTNATGYFAYVWTPSETGVFEVKAVTVVEDISIESGTVTVTVEAPFDVMLYVYIAIVVIVVVVVIVIVLYMRRRGKKAEEELPPS